MKIKMDNVSKKYGNKIILEKLNFELALDNRLISLLGPNGAGKTTIMKLLSGIVCPYRGCIIVQGEDNQYIDYLKWAHEHVAYLSPDERYLGYKNTAIDNILYYGIIKGIDKKLILANLERFSSQIESKSLLEKRIEEMSTGQKKVIKLLSIFCTGLPVLFLDEPTTGLDIDTKEDLIKMIKELSSSMESTILISSHDLEFISNLADAHIFIFNGAIKGFVEHTNNEKELKLMYEKWRDEEDDKNL